MKIVPGDIIVTRVSVGFFSLDGMHSCDIWRAGEHLLVIAFITGTD